MIASRNGIFGNLANFIRRNAPKGRQANDGDALKIKELIQAANLRTNQDNQLEQASVYAIKTFLNDHSPQRVGAVA